MKGMVSEAKGQMVLVPERYTETRLITSLLFYLGVFLFVYSSFSSVIYSSNHWSAENSSSCSSDSYSN